MSNKSIDVIAEFEKQYSFQEKYDPKIKQPALIYNRDIPSCYSVVNQILNLTRFNIQIKQLKCTQPGFIPLDQETFTKKSKNIEQEIINQPQAKNETLIDPVSPKKEQSKQEHRNETQPTPQKQKQKPQQEIKQEPRKQVVPEKPKQEIKQQPKKQTQTTPQKPITPDSKQKQPLQPICQNCNIRNEDQKIINQNGLTNWLQSKQLFFGILGLFIVLILVVKICKTISRLIIYRSKSSQMLNQQSQVKSHDVMENSSFQPKNIVYKSKFQSSVIENQSTQKQSKKQQSTDQLNNIQ